MKLGHVAVDGSKVKANASKHKAMSYKRMQEAEAKLLEEVEALLAEAQRIDEEEDAKYGKGKRGDELPDELARRESRLKKIRDAKAALEEEAKAAAAEKARRAEQRIAERERQERETGKKMGGTPPQVPDPEKAVPDPKSQKNFTDPESRIMPDAATKSFQQAYNVQIAVDDEAQVVVAGAVTQQSNDKKQLIPLLEKIEAHFGRLPEKTSADNGYFSAEVVEAPSLSETDLYIAVGKEKSCVSSQPEFEDNETSRTRMQAKLRTEEGRSIYKMRKAIVEPVFGQIKHARLFRQFSFRGFEKVTSEWNLMTLTHNLLKVFRSGWKPPTTQVPANRERNNSTTTHPILGSSGPPQCRERLQPHSPQAPPPASSLQPPARWLAEFLRQAPRVSPWTP